MSLRQFKRARVVVRAIFNPKRGIDMTFTPSVDGLRDTWLPVWSVAGFSVHRLGTLRLAFRSIEDAYHRRAYRLFEAISQGNPKRARAFLVSASRVDAMERLARRGAWPGHRSARRPLSLKERAAIARFIHARGVFVRRCDSLGAVIAELHPIWWPALVARFGGSDHALAVLDREWVPNSPFRYPDYKNTRLKFRRYLSGFQLLAWEGTTLVSRSINKHFPQSAPKKP